MKWRIVGFITLCIVFLSLAMLSPTYALKKRVRAARAVYSSARLSRDTHSIVATFYDVAGVTKFDYVLSYSANGVPQGVVGSFTPNGSGNQTRDLYFGTCSKGVCTPHYGITSATLTITATTGTGATYIKRYIINNV